MALPLQKSPEVPQSGTHHHPPPPLNPRSGPARHLHLIPFWQSDRFFFLFFFFNIIIEGGGPDILTPSHPSPGVIGSHAGQQWPLLPFGVLITSSSSPQGSTQSVWHLFLGAFGVGVAEDGRSFTAAANTVVWHLCLWACKYVFCPP